MRRFRILNAEPLGYSEKALTILQQIGDVVEGPPNRAELLLHLSECDVLIVRLAHQIDREIIDAGRRLKAIVTATTGLDHIDIEYACAKRITVLSLRNEFEFLRTISATAEHTWALLLALLRRIPQAFASVLDGNWNRDEFRGHELNGKRMGIIGLGRIGRKVAGYGMAFGMSVAAYDPYAMEWVEGVERLGQLTDLLRKSNVLSLHVPLNTETVHIIGEKELALLPQGSIVVNTARGRLLNEDALVSVLESGHLAGAALDVIDHERVPEQRQCGLLLAYAQKHQNLLLTPHIAGATHEAMAKTEVFMAGKLAAFLNGLEVERAIL